MPELHDCPDCTTPNESVPLVAVSDDRYECEECDKQFRHCEDCDELREVNESARTNVPYCVECGYTHEEYPAEIDEDGNVELLV